MPLQEMMGEGDCYGHDDRACRANITDEANVYCTGFNVNLQKFFSFEVWRVVAFKVVRIKHLCLLVVDYPLEEPHVVTVTGEAITLQIQVFKG